MSERLVGINIPKGRQEGFGLPIRVSFDALCFSEVKADYKNLVFIGGASGVGKSTITGELNKQGFNVVGSGDLLCQAAGIRQEERHRFYTLDFRKYEQGMIDALEHEIDILPPGETLVYDTRYAVTSEEISNGAEKWIPAMSQKYLEQILNISQLNVWNILVEPTSCGELCVRRSIDTAKQRPGKIATVSNELIHTRRQFSNYTRVGRNIASNPVRGVAVVSNPGGRDQPFHIARAISSFVR